MIRQIMVFIAAQVLPQIKSIKLASFASNKQLSQYKKCEMSSRVWIITKL